MSRTYLPNGCYFTALTVNPSNWRNKKASVNRAWYFTYHFYDPKLKKNRLISCRGMNSYKTQHERMMMTERLIADEISLLKVEGFNPITKTLTPFYDNDSDITPEMPISHALTIAHNKLKCSPETKKDIGYALKYIKQAVTKAGLHHMNIGQVSRKHVLRILEACGSIKETWSAHGFNKYRTYLIMLFKVIVQYEAIENNPVLLIEKEKTVKKLRDTLSKEQRKAIAEHLKPKYYTFYRFIEIFFHSGARINELRGLKAMDVDLAGQRYRLIVKKGKQQKEVWKTIKDVALPFWSEIVREARKDDYLFSRGLKPGPSMIRREQLIRRWKNHVKDALNITADLYSLKHSNTTETVDILSEQDAAKLNSHEGTAMVVSIYDVNREQRQHERLKKINNTF